MPRRPVRFFLALRVIGRDRAASRTATEVTKPAGSLDVSVFLTVPAQNSEPPGNCSVSRATAIPSWA